MPLEFTASLLLFALTSFGLAWPLAARLALDEVEKIAATVALSLLLVGLLAWSIYVFALPGRIMWALPACAIVGLVQCRPTLVAAFRDADVRVLLGAQLLVTAGVVDALSFIVSYSGGGWAGDWFEHWERAKFFLNHEAMDYRFLGHYTLPARPPLANLITGAFLNIGGVDFPRYQFLTALLGSLVFLPAALLARRFGGPRAIPLLAVLVLVNPLFVQNATFAWTKLPAAFFVLTSLYFFLRARDFAATRIAPFLFAATLAGGILTHYSAAPYAIVLTVMWVILGWTQRRDPRWWRATLTAGLPGTVILSTWFLWSLSHYGAAGTFLANSTITSSQAYRGSQLFKIALNLRDTLIPHFLRTPDPVLLAQTSGWGAARDWFFQAYQLNLFFAFGSVAWFVLGRELWRTSQAAAVATRTLWTAGVTTLVLLCIAAQGDRDEWGLVHICLQSLVLLGLAFLAARWSTLTRSWRRALAAGAVVDFVFGIVLQLAAESRVLDHPRAGEFTAYNDAALMNLAAKVQHEVVFLADVSASPITLKLALSAAILMLTIARASNSDAPSASSQCPTPVSPSPS